MDLEKAFDHVSWSFLAGLMHSMGFGPRMSRLIYTLSLGSQSRIMMNGGVTSPVSLTRSLRQGCPLSPLLFALVTHPMLTLLTQLARDGEVVGLTLPSGQQLVGQALADDSFMFLKANKANIDRAMAAWSLFAKASGLHINTQKSALLSCTEIDLHGLGWQGLVVPRGTIVRYLGYPIGVEVTNKQLLDWISGRIGDKFVYWKSQAWPFHTRLKVAQVIMLAMISYFLPLLPWSRKALTTLTQPIRFMLWKKRSNKPGLAWVSWKHITTPKRLGGAALLDVWVHLIARRWTLLQAMCVDSQPWIDMIIAFLEDVGIVQGKTRIAAPWWDVLNASQSVRVSASPLLDHLVKSWQEVLRFTSWKPPDSRRVENSLLGEVLATSRVITWPAKHTCRRQFNRMARLGVVRLCDTLLPGRSQMLSFRRARHIFSVPRVYKDIWLRLQQQVQSLGGLPRRNSSRPWDDWVLGRKTRLLKASANAVYHLLVQEKKWLAQKVNKVWHVKKTSSWWKRMLFSSWHSKLPFQGKVFIWRVIVGGLPLATVLQRRRLSNGNCFFCETCQESSHHRFISCPVARQIWAFISSVWQKVTGQTFSPKQWVFQLGRNDQQQEVFFHYFRWLGLWHNWLMRNAFIFDSQSGVKGYVQRIRGLLLWQVSSLTNAHVITKAQADPWLRAIRIVGMPRVIP